MHINGPTNVYSATNTCTSIRPNYKWAIHNTRICSTIQIRVQCVVCCCALYVHVLDWSGRACTQTRTVTPSTYIEVSRALSISRSIPNRETVSTEWCCECVFSTFAVYLIRAQSIAKRFSGEFTHSHTFAKLKHTNRMNSNDTRDGTTTINKKHTNTTRFIHKNGDTEPPIPLESVPFHNLNEANVVFYCCTR